LVRKNNYVCIECAVFVIILWSRFTTLVDPVTQNHNLEADFLLYFGSNCHAFGERHCL